MKFEYGDKLPCRTPSPYTDRRLVYMSRDAYYEYCRVMDEISKTRREKND